MERLINASQRAKTLYELLIRRTDMPSGTFKPPGLMAIKFVPSVKNENFDEISISTPFDHDNFEIALFKNNEFVQYGEKTVVRFSSVDAIIKELHRLVSL